MKCPTCEAQGTRSIVYVGPSTTTTLSGQVFYDEDGRFHMHDPNTTTSEYNCSLGHRWSVQAPAHQCWCEMLEKTEITFGPIDEPSEAPPPKPTPPPLRDMTEKCGQLVPVVKPLSIRDSYNTLFGHGEAG
jgi:hypothetical protein